MEGGDGIVRMPGNSFNVQPDVFPNAEVGVLSFGLEEMAAFLVFPLSSLVCFVGTCHASRFTLTKTGLTAESPRTSS
eukprot:1903877-Amphidinium_carterae.2